MSVWGWAGERAGSRGKYLWDYNLYNYGATGIFYWASERGDSSKVLLMGVETGED